MKGPRGKDAARSRCNFFGVDQPLCNTTLESALQPDSMEYAPETLVYGYLTALTAHSSDVCVVTGESFHEPRGVHAPSPLKSNPYNFAQLIDAHLPLLRAGAPRSYAHPERVAHARIAGAPLVVLFPVVRDMHWTLLAVYVAYNAACIYDSRRGGSSRPAIAPLLGYYTGDTECRLLRAPEDVAARGPVCFIDADTPQQAGGWECGYAVLAIAERIIARVRRGDIRPLLFADDGEERLRDTITDGMPAYADKVRAALSTALRRACTPAADVRSLPLYKELKRCYRDDGSETGYKLSSTLLYYAALRMAGGAPPERDFYYVTQTPGPGKPVIVSGKGVARDALCVWFFPGQMHLAVAGEQPLMLTFVDDAPGSQRGKGLYAAKHNDGVRLSPQQCWLNSGNAMPGPPSPSYRSAWCLLLLRFLLRARRSSLPGTFVLHDAVQRWIGVQPPRYEAFMLANVYSMVLHRAKLDMVSPQVARVLVTENDAALYQWVRALEAAERGATDMCLVDDHSSESE